MSAFTTISAIAAPIEGLNMDTDQIIPARFLKFDREAGYGNFLFHDLRFDAEGKERTEFVLNREPYRAARILVADENFGCGSSREGAVYALHDFGVRVVIAPRFGDIYYSNSLRNGLLPAIVTASQATELRHHLALTTDPVLTVDLMKLTIQLRDGAALSFTLDSFSRDCLLQGVDEIDLALEQVTHIDTFESEYFRKAPWLT